MVASSDAGSDSPLIAFAGGGTGGHLYPALAVAAALRARLPGIRLLFFATQRPLDRRIIGATDVELIEQPLVPLGRSPWRWPGFLLGFRRSSLLCRRSIADLRPSVVVGTGGLGSVPALREASRAGIATAMLNPDAVPGRANKFLAGKVDLVFAQWAETTEHFGRMPRRKRSRVLITGCPVRAAFNEARQAGLTGGREAGVKQFQLTDGKKTVLITGASQGARNINRAVCANLDLFKHHHREWQIIHLTGEGDHDEVTQAYRQAGLTDRGRSVEAVVLRYTEHMADALAASDLVVGRAGASSLAEITAVGRAAILMPYPYHKDRHQLANARCLENASAARIVPDRIDPEKNGPALRAAMEELMADAGKRGMMAEASRRMGRGQAAAAVADHLLTLCGIGNLPTD